MENLQQPQQALLAPATGAVKGNIYFYTKSRQPVLELKLGNEATLRHPFRAVQPGRTPGELCWLADPMLPAAGPIEFRIDLGNGTLAAPDGHGSYDYYKCELRTLWLQDGQIFDYEPQTALTLSRVIKIPYFLSSLPRRSLYVYLPRGYDQNIGRSYPVIYMHDGQNCFESYVQDSYSGSWRADQVADALINQGQMQECIIVGISNGGHARMAEYMPPYTTFQPLPFSDKKSRMTPIVGRADRTLITYRDEVAPYIERYFRARPGRDNRATVGSSMGGLFSTYIAWHYPEFARQHAIMSPSYWVTRRNDDKYEAIERLRTDKPRPVRIWLDSGTQDAPDVGDDGMAETILARDALLNNGYTIGPDFQYLLDEGATHHESAWAARLHRVFRFLFPLS